MLTEYCLSAGVNADWLALTSNLWPFLTQECEAGSKCFVECTTQELVLAITVWLGYVASMMNKLMGIFTCG